VEILWSSELVENDSNSVRVRSVLEGSDATPAPLPNDHLFIFAGGELPTPFLKRCGIEIDTKFGQP
jgi:thioredoxin reductase